MYTQSHRHLCEQSSKVCWPPQHDDDEKPKKMNNTANDEDVGESKKKKKWEENEMTEREYTSYQTMDIMVLTFTHI